MEKTDDILEQMRSMKSSTPHGKLWANTIRSLANRLDKARKREMEGVHHAMVLIAGIEMEDSGSPPRLWTALEDAYDALSEAMGTDGDTSADVEEAKATGRHFVVRPYREAALRETVRSLLELLSDKGIDEDTARIAHENPVLRDSLHTGRTLEVLRKAKAVLAEQPLRNHEVGTPEEQAKRFKEYCRSGDCRRRICNSYGYEHLFHYTCFPIWAQMPYGERQPLSRPAGAGLNRQPKNKENDNGKDA
jgi:hypothetical protein